MPSYLVLARKYRPATFRDVIGQDHVIQTLCNSIVSGRIAHAFLFCGVRGVGKTTIARVLAKALNCSGRKDNEPDPCNTCASCREIADGVSVDVQEIDGASHTSVENIREINENVKYPPVSSPHKIIIIDEVHMISINAFNALLKTLEEPPAHVKFMFATTEAHKVPATIHSRCQKFTFRTISIRDMVEGMARILKKEGLEATEEALGLLAKEAQGSFRDALSLLDQVIAYGSEGVTAQSVMATLGIAGRGVFAELMAALLDRDAPAALGKTRDLFQEGYSPEQFALDLIQYVRNLVLVKTLPPEQRSRGVVDATPGELEELERLAQRASREDLQNLFSILYRSESDIRRAGNPWVALEMTILRVAYAPHVVELAEIIRRIDSAPRGSASVIPRQPTGAESDRKTGGRGPAVTRAVTEPSQTTRPTEAPAVARDGAGGFIIEEVTPALTGHEDEVWSRIRREVEETGVDNVLASVMEHGRMLPNMTPGRIEIGFHKAFHKEQFESRWRDKPEIKRIFANYLGDAEIKILTLAQETSLEMETPYGDAKNGETDRNRALKQEALDHPVVKAVRGEFEDSSIDEIKVLS
ncbi:MAG: DNA polymerase III subunit gamma/tau [Deltaproteobacteria bacterium]|nr:DNA polymerase III subunit gamma/tau [Deltaproteobacteria bacterium]